ncbi:hypothetical protein [Streptomyces sp. NBC_00557]|uniref:hypothetical protein n=1 Tax=Streptomyces sp. NBC_00557 TaxID=2975776 RepID=UPI002E81C8DE|nr:hypothetical protein [Streptomyces sp. NBC_00557]WUC36348.1 hypothetical protein OG956_20065 [Streptomyces sp. NBC_00557]
MDQATGTTPAADSFEHAHAVIGSLITGLAVRPFAVETEQDFPSGWRVHCKYRAENGVGLYELAAALDVPITRADTAFGVFLDAIARVQGIEVRGSALVSTEQAAEFEGQPAPTTTVPETTTTAPAEAATIVPLARATTDAAQVPAVTPVPAINTERLDEEDEPRCVRCGCTENAACEGGCYWVRNRQMVALCSACATTEELQAMAYVPAGAEAADGAR